MSSTRNPIRTGPDFYRTPEWLIHAIEPTLLERFPGGVRRALEPSAGDGAIMRELRRVPVARWTLVEIQEEHQEGLCLLDVPQTFDVRIADFLSLPPEPVYDLVIGNPPFSLALEFVQRSLEWIHPHGLVVMLLRVAFVTGGQDRSEWMRTHMPDGRPSPKRPSFDLPVTPWCADGVRHKWQRPASKKDRTSCAGCGAIKPGSDSAEYGWFLWGKRPRTQGTWSLLEVPA